MAKAQRDIWSRWLLERRFGGDPQQRRAVLDYLHPVRDKVLDHARLGEGEILLDVGCGDGFIGFGALEKVEGSRVIFSDISQELLDDVQTIAQEMNLLHRCTFLRASADDLSALEDASVDVVTTRSVLIYVKAKQQALDEFHRVLKRGGRLSLFEPINRFAHPEPAHLFWGCDITPMKELAHRVKAVYHRHQPPETDPMLDFDERDLFASAERAGFAEVHLEFQAEIKPLAEARQWQAYLHTAPNPKAPTLEEAISQALTPTEAGRFTAHLRPLVETGNGIIRSAVAYLWATK
jgi:arsenite methyltransferase